MTSHPHPNRRVLITGGAGFIGANAGARFLNDGWDVTIWDNLSRPGGRSNLEWLSGKGKMKFVEIDLRRAADITRHFAHDGGYDVILHCAGQVAVTTSVTNPLEDFECNAIGTFNLLEAMRKMAPEAFFIFASTNKVYGGMEEATIVERNGRYEYKDSPQGVSETQLLDFHSPYGCSKGAADQYVRDYSRIYGLATTSFRQSCIYGYRQFGMEDQGWVAWFIIAHALGKPVTIFGDGKQTRDVLFIDDLLDAYCLACENRAKTSGQIYNIGGGSRNQLSLRELIAFVEKETGRAVKLSYAAERPGDQKVFVADTRKAKRDFGWEPAHLCEDGIRKLNQWVHANLALFR